MKADLETASAKGKETDLPEILYEDAAGQVADFHALRHSYITLLAQSGVHPKTAQDLARHSDINLTLSRYTHTVLTDRSEALSGLPDLSPDITTVRL